jgi:hypothetical protein
LFAGHRKIFRFRLAADGFGAPFGLPAALLMEAGKKGRSRSPFFNVQS